VCKRCAKVNLSHPCFADGLLIFFEGYVHSVATIKSILLEFQSLSGLRANPDKSRIFCVGIPSVIKASSNFRILYED
jgi:hypothetical protein